MLRTRCILSPREDNDGIRISVMSRHTLNDGVTLDSRITPKLYDLYLSNLGPHSSLLGDYYKRGLSWDDFERNYLDYIRQPHFDLFFNRMTILLESLNLTLLGIEETPERCHRRLLAEEIQRRYSGFNLDIQ